MITLTKLNGTEFILNSSLIETIYENPDTTIHLTNGTIYIVKESKAEVVRRTLQYHRQAFANIFNTGARDGIEKENNVKE